MTAQLLIPQGGATVDSNGRKKLCPMYANIRAAERDFPWARVLVGYIRSPNKNKKPANISQVGWLRQKEVTAPQAQHAQGENGSDARKCAPPCADWRENAAARPRHSV